MSDAVRMIDLAPLSRSMDEFRRADPEYKTLADRVAAQAALRHLEKAHEDVGAPEGPEKAKVDEPTDRNRKRRQRGHLEDPEAKKSEKPELILEQEEGRLLDIKA